MSYEAWRITFQSGEQAAKAAYMEAMHLRAQRDAEREKVKELEQQRDTFQRWMVEGYESLAAAQATIAEMLSAIGKWDRAETDHELQEAEAALIDCLRPTNQDALHEALARECERLASMWVSCHTAAAFAERARQEAYAHRASKEQK